MRRKITIEFVKKYAKEFGYECLSDEYVRNSEKLEFKCDKGHKYKATWTTFRRSKCPECFNNRKILTIHKINKYVRKYNYKCLSNEYKNAQEKLLFECNKGHKVKIIYSNFYSGGRCSICNLNKRRLGLKYINEKINNIAKGYKCLSSEYINNSTKMLFRCEMGHKYEATWKRFSAGNRCPYCSNNKIDINIIRKYCNKRNIKLLSNTYKNSITPLLFECESGHKFKMSWKVFRRGNGCNNISIDKFNPSHIFKEYTRRARRITEYNYNKYIDIINPHNTYRSKLYHLDHIYSISKGFNNKIPYYIIGSPINLRIVGSKTNLSKNYRCDMRKSELYELYNNFNKEVTFANSAL